MDRRRFIISGSALAGTLAMPVNSFAMSDITGKLSADAGEKTRLTAEDISQLGIQAPIKQVTAPGGHTVSFPLKIRIARQYQQAIYVWFENESMIRVYDQSGNEQSPVTLPPSLSALKDFALDSNGNLFVLPVGQHRVFWVSWQGDILGTIGDFGTDAEDQLNGPTSLTLDQQDRIHVLNTGSRTVKVFKNNGVYLFEYGQSRWGQQRKLLAIDGTDTISASGGMMRDSQWQFSPSGELQ